ncbi:kelch repeat-containing protein, partial [Vibrio parahaemolyticus]
MSLAPPLATPRYLHTATRLDDGRILVVGGRDGNTPLDT